MEPSKRKAGRPPSEKKNNPELADLKITQETDRVLTTHAKKLKMSKRKYANAAIAYFAETGLDPTKERPHGLANVSAKVSHETLAVRQQNADIGNRLISILRGWEKTLYGFLQQQQAGTVNYLQQIESNLLAHQVAVETSYLAPMVEQLFKVNLEAFVIRDFAVQLFAKAQNMPASSADTQMQLVTNGRDQQLATAVREFIKTNNVPTPTLSPKPQVPATPAKLPSAPSTPGNATSAAGATPK